MLEKNPSWGAIIKSKNLNMERFLSLPDGQEIIHRLELLLNRGRVCILSNSVSPVTVAEYSALSICFGINSAGIVVGAHGFRAVHWDCSGWSVHPFYRDSEQKIVYHTLDELEQAIMQASKGDERIGDFSRWRREFNHLLDTNASSRVGIFFQDFMSQVMKTSDEKESLQYAVNKFAADNDIKKEFWEGNNLWDEELNCVYA